MTTEDPPFTIPISKPWLPPIDLYRDAVDDIFRRRFVSNFSKYCKRLEASAAIALDHPSPLCVSSCDIGLALVWRALNCRVGEVIVPSFTFCSTVNALRWNNIDPIFADIDADTLCVDVDHVRRLITRKTIGIAATHIFGHPAPIDALETLAKEHDLKLVFDAAHGLGACFRERRLGAYGDASAFSLSGTKIATGGEGGLVTFRDPEAGMRFRALRGYGFMKDYDCSDIGLNGKLSELNAALAGLSIDMLDELLDRRLAIAAAYRRGLEDVSGVRFQADVARGNRHSYTYLAVLFDTPALRAAVETALRQRGVQTKRYFLPVHTMHAYQRHARTDLPATQHVYHRILCLPIYFDLEDSDIRLICETIAGEMSI